MASSRASAASVQKKFGYYRDAALRRLDRQVLAVEELGTEDIAAIRRARVPKSKRHKASAK